MQQPVVAVWVLTYNHGKYISRAIEGMVMQKTNFSYKIYIGEDCSTDDTRDICIGYAKKYSDKINLYLNEKNDHRKNGEKIYDACFNSGAKYIAMCEGDDYWCDENKLQRQVDFLEANAGYAICFHKVYELKENNNLSLSILNTCTSEQTYSIADLARGNFIHTPSVVFRNGLFKEFPDWFYQSPVGDYVLHMLNAQHGLIKYFPEPMAVYRVHNNSTWSSLSKESRVSGAITVFDFLTRYDFEPYVIEILIESKRMYVETYLNMLMNGADWTLFLEKLAQFSKEDEMIGRKWLLEYYPLYIKKIKASPKRGFVSSVRKMIRNLKNKIQ